MSKVIYVASPLGASTKEEIEANIDRAIEYGEYVKSKGHKPIVVHKIANILDDTSPRERACGMQIDLEIIFPLADEVWVFGNRISQGMQKEIELAFERKIPVVFVRECELVGKE